MNEQNLSLNDSAQQSMFSIQKISAFVRGLSKQDYSLIAIIMLSVATAAYTRLIGLDNWSVAGDEYFIAKSVEFILNSGLPSFPNGGYYDRGILYQYLAAFLVILGVNLIYAIRIIPAISNLIAIPAIYLLAKKSGGKIIAAVMVFLFCFSIWEAEFGRFARMYSPFQTIFVWYLLAFYRYLIEGDKGSEKWLYILSLLSVFIFEGSVFLLCLNFIPHLFKKKIVTKSLIISILIFLVGYFILTFDFRNLFVESNLQGALGESRSKFRIPTILFGQMISHSALFLIGFLIISAAYVFSLYRIIAARSVTVFYKISLSIIVSAVFINQFGLAFLLLFSFMMIDWIQKKELIKRNNLIIIGFFLAAAIFYYGFLLSGNFLQNQFPDFQISTITDKMKRGSVFLFNYPFNYTTLWMYYEIMPFFTIISSLIILFGLVYYSFYENSKGIKLLFFVFIGIMLLVLVIYTPIKSSRYSFFLFPLFYLLFALSLFKLTGLFSKNGSLREIFFGIMLIIFLSVSEDFDLNHLASIDKKDYNFRLAVDKNLTAHFYDRWDFATPSDFVNESAHEGDIVISSHVTADYYLHNLTHIYMDAETNKFSAEQSAVDGKREIWSNAEFITSNEELLKLTGSSDRDVWFLAVSELVNLQGLSEISFYENYKANLVYTSIDSTLSVYHFPN